jgi:nucleoid-associated protein YgaU
MLAYAEGEESAAVQHVRDAAHDYDSLLASKASAPVKMAASVNEAIRSASARFARTARPLAARRRPALRAAGAGALAAMCLLAIAGAGITEVRPFRETLTALSARYASRDKRPQPQILAQWSPAQFKTRSDEAAKPAPKPISVAPLNVHDGSAGSANELIMRGPVEEPSTTVLPVPEKSKPETNPAGNVIPVKLSSPGNISAPANTSSETVVVGTGDTIYKIAKRFYGSFGTDELGRLTAANPEIKDMNLIFPGQSIRVSQTGK